MAVSRAWRTSVSCGYRTCISMRRFCSASKEVGSKVNPPIITPLTKPLEGLAPAKFASASNLSSETQVSTLENGLRVASENKFGQFCTVGVLMDSGSRYESLYPSGISHFLEKLAFSSTSKFKDRDEIMQMLEEHGGICDCQGSRDTLIYAVSANTRGLPKVMDLLSEVVLRPKISQTELTEARDTIQFELETLQMRPDPEPLLIEMIHSAAYRENTLGLPKLCPDTSLGLINQDSINTYFYHHHRPERMVLAGVGVEHETLVQLARECFQNKVPIWEEDSSGIDKTKIIDHSLSQYTGGLLKVEKDLSNVSLGPNPMPELAHCVIALESCSHQDPDFVPFCVLNMMMGGGGSFSAGGPGKGMYTRLYLNVLNRYHWIENATAYHHSYNDSGIFCIHGSTHPAQFRELFQVLIREIVQTQNSITPEELGRAKRQLQSMLLMNLESRPVIFEDVGRQVLASGFRQSAEHYFEEIEKISSDDIRRVAERMLNTPPSIAALGDLTNLPKYSDISSALSSQTGTLPGRSFRKFFG